MSPYLLHLEPLNVLGSDRKPHVESKKTFRLNRFCVFGFYLFYYFLLILCKVYLNDCLCANGIHVLALGKSLPYLFQTCTLVFSIHRALVHVRM